MLYHLVIVAFVLWFAYVRYRNRHKRQLADMCSNSLKSLPVIGVAHHFVGTDEDRMNTLMKIGREAIKQGGVAGGWLLNMLMVVIADPFDAEEAMRESLRKMDGLDLTGDLIGNGHMFAKVPIWRPRRKVIAPLLSQKNTNLFLEIFTRQSEIMMDRLSKLSGKGPLSISKFITAYCMDSICESSLGIKMDTQNNPRHPFLSAFHRFGRMLVTRLLQPWLYPDYMYKLMPCYRSYRKQIDILQEFVKQVIMAKRIQFRNAENENRAECDQDQIAVETAGPWCPETKNFISEIGRRLRDRGYDHRSGWYLTQRISIAIQRDQFDNRKSFLEQLIDKGYNDIELQEEMLVLVLAGTDTSAVGASFTAVMLSQHQEVQDKLYRELMEVLGDSDKPLEASDVPRLKYLEVVIKETLRLYPPVPAIVRIVEKDYILPSGYKLVPEVGAVIHIWAMHRNPTFWGKDAEEFRPERFLDTTLKHPAAFMPFSFGVRNCIGARYAMLSMMTVIANLVRKYKLLPSKKISLQKSGHMKSRPLRTKIGITMNHVDGYQVKIEPRTQN